VEARFSPLKRVQILTQDMCMLCAEHTIGSEIVMEAPDVSPRRLGHVESRFAPFGDSVSFSARLVDGLCETYHRLINHFGCIQ
jgi:hypothetical protein